MQRLSTTVDINTATLNLEDSLFSADIIIDAGFDLEIYGNPDGKASDSKDGASFFTHIDRDITYGQLLTVVAHLGSVRKNELSIRTVGSDESIELGFCAENPISKALDTEKTASA